MISQTAAATAEELAHSPLNLFEQDSLRCVTSSTVESWEGPINAIRLGTHTNDVHRIQCNRSFLPPHCSPFQPLNHAQLPQSYLAETRGPDPDDRHLREVVVDPFENVAEAGDDLPLNLYPRLRFRLYEQGWFHRIISLLDRVFLQSQLVYMVLRKILRRSHSGGARTGNAGGHLCAGLDLWDPTGWQSSRNKGLGN